MQTCYNSNKNNTCAVRFIQPIFISRVTRLSSVLQKTTFGEKSQLPFLSLNWQVSKQQQGANNTGIWYWLIPRGIGVDQYHLQITIYNTVCRRHIHAYCSTSLTQSLSYHLLLVQCTCFSGVVSCCSHRSVVKYSYCESTFDSYISVSLLLLVIGLF